MNDDGTMARGNAIERYAAKHGLVALTIAELELADYRRSREAQAARRWTGIAGCLARGRRRLYPGSIGICALFTER
jgi:hypothetical protein